MQSVLTITLNPAIDVTTAVGELAPRAKLRCETPLYQPGGGGINISRMIAELGGHSRAFVGLAGHSGQFMKELIEAEGIEPETFELDGETRMTLQVVDRSSDQQYRFVLPGPAQPADTEDRLLSVLADCIREGSYRYVVVSGSAPPGLPDDFYGRLAGRVSDTGARLILDTSGKPLQAALGRGLYLVKPDQAEAEFLLRSMGGEGGSVEDVAGKLFDSRAAEVVIVTFGAKGAVLVSEEGQTRFQPPHVDVKSTVGAGDSFVAALCWALASDWPLVEACRYGVAAAAAAVLTEATELAYRTDVDDLYRRMKEAES
jgi:6-phosphofructokinase 2